MVEKSNKINLINPIFLLCRIVIAISYLELFLSFSVQYYWKPKVETKNSLKI